MKRFFQILLGVIALILLLLLVIPSLFKGKIEQKVTSVINENITATVSFDKFSLSMFRHFPDLTMGLDGLTVINEEPFEGDTLLHVGTFATSIDLWSAIKGEGIEVKSVMIDQPQASLKVNRDSVANWDIVPMEEEEMDEDTASTASDFSVKLTQFEIKDASLGFADQTMDFSTDIDDMDLTMQGDLSQASTNLDLNTSIQRFNLDFGGTKYVKDAGVSLDAIVGADLENLVFTFRDNELLFNELALGFDGTVGIPEEGYDLDLALSAKETDFKTLLSMVPETYMKDFEDLQTDGNLKLEASARGHYLDADHLPAFNMVLNVSNGRIQYPDLPKSIDDIQIDMTIDNPGGDMDQTVTDISKFHFELDNNPFDADLRVETPVSNATYSGSMKGTINLASLSEAVPMDSVDLRGEITTDLTLNGDYEMVEKELYEDIEADGTIGMTDFYFKTPDLQEGFLISKADLQVTPRFMELRTFTSSLGNSDFDLKGRMENYLSYALKDGTLTGKLDHRSRMVDTNELMKLAGEDTTDIEEDTTAMELVIVPKNLDFTLSSDIDRLLYDKLVMNNTRGAVRIRDGRIILNDLRSNTLDGNMVVSGEYNTADTLKPFVDFDMRLQSIDINQAANSFSMVDSLMPIAKKATGKVTTQLNFNTLIGEGMSPVLSSLDGGGLLESQGVEISGSKVQNSLATMLKDDKYKTTRARDLAINFALENGNVIVEPFNASLFGKELTISGVQGLDQTLDYVIKMPVSQDEIGAVAGLLGANLPSSAREIMVDILVQGTVKDPKLKFNLDEDFENQAKETIKEEAEKAFDKLKDDPEVKKKMDEAKEKLKDLF
ncbi:MAG: AsmA-like C-terminal region-containing protein [Marinilabilia sp.]